MWSDCINLQGSLFLIIIIFVLPRFSQRDLCFNIKDLFPIIKHLADFFVVACTPTIPEATSFVPSKFIIA